MLSGLKRLILKSIKLISIIKFVYCQTCNMKERRSMHASLLREGLHNSFDETNTAMRPGEKGRLGVSATLCFLN